MQLQQFVLAVLVSIAASAVLLVNAQSGPFPPRLNIPGAVPVSGGGTRPQFRNDKLVRVRRPIALRTQSTYVPSVTPRIIEEPKPVTESAEDEQPDAFLPQLLREQQLAQAQQAQFQQQAAAFFNGEPNSIQDTPSLNQLLQQQDEETATAALASPATRFPERPTPAAASPSPSSRPAFNDYGIGSFGANSGSSGAQRFGLERPQQSAPAPAPAPTPQRVNVIRTRPSTREPRPQFEAQAAPAPAPVPAPQRSRPRPAPVRPLIEQNQVQDDREPSIRRQRPVAQTLRKWREENEDGSITWGYENDDGSFKEELIGIDCITKGTYGYVDPDGNKREYHYETGVRCDPNTRETEQEAQQNGFINYEENKAVLPNGIEIDMSKLGKKKSNRPGPIYRN